MKNLTPLFRLSALAVLLATLTGCQTTHTVAPLPSAPIEPKTYAIVLFLPEGEEIADEQRTEILSFARDTLLASGLVLPLDQMVDDPERAELLFRGRVQGGFLTEIAGVPTFNQQHTVVLSQPRRTEDRIWWDAYYPFGYPSFNDDYYYSGFPYPGPGWGYPTQYHNRVNRGRGSPHDYVDHDNRRVKKPRGENTSPRPDTSRRGDRSREYSSQRPTSGASIRDERGGRASPPRTNPLPVVSHAPRTNTVTMRPNIPPPSPPPAPPRPSYTPPAADRRAPTPREEYYSNKSEVIE